MNIKIYFCLLVCVVSASGVQLGAMQQSVEITTVGHNVIAFLQFINDEGLSDLKAEALEKYFPELLFYWKLKKGDVNSTSFMNATLISFIMSDSDFKGSIFDGASIKQSGFTNTNLTCATFRGSTLIKTTFENSKLIFADFSNVKSLNGVDFRGAKLFGANFNNANVNGAIVDGVNFVSVRNLSEKQKQYLQAHGAIVK